RFARLWRRHKLALALGAVGVLLLAALGVGGFALLRGARERSVQGTKNALAAIEKRVHDANDIDAFLADNAAEVGSNVPAEMVPAVDLFWAKTFHRRARSSKARVLAAKHVDAPGAPGFEAKRILADLLLAEGRGVEAHKLLAALRDSGTPALAHWAILREAVAECSSPA